MWRDLARLAVVDGGHRVGLASSHCPDGSRYDRHSPDAPRFLRTVGDEGVIFEAEGPGAVTRIWMTQGHVISRPLDADISIRITVDGVVKVELPLPGFFGSGWPPFVPPLVADRLKSSGGNVSYVPIPYRASCRISLVGAADRTIWYQVHHHRMENAEGVVPFTGEEDLAQWAALLRRPGHDPWPGGPFPTASGALELAPGEVVELAALAGPDLVNGLLLRAPRTTWPELKLQLAFDGRVTVDLPLDRFFGVGRALSGGTRALLIGVEDDDLYCYFPMPFFRTAALRLGRDLGGDPEGVEVEWAVRRAGRPPDPDSGHFGARRTVTAVSTPGHDSPWLELEGQGRWVGLFAEMGSLGGRDRDYLEGDERVFVDGAIQPLLHGTGVEDFFAGGFYFRISGMDPVTFHTALAGMSHDSVDAEGHLTGMYRLMLTDAPVFSRGIRAGVEGGPWGKTPIRVDAVAWYYIRPPVVVGRSGEGRSHEHGARAPGRGPGAERHALRNPPAR